MRIGFDADIPIHATKGTLGDHKHPHTYASQAAPNGIPSKNPAFASQGWVARLGSPGDGLKRPLTYSNLVESDVSHFPHPAIL